MTSADLRIAMLNVTVPVMLPPTRRKSRVERDAPAIHLELWIDSCRVWDNATYTSCADYFRFHADDRDGLIKIPFFDEVYRYLASQRAAHRSDPIGDFLAPAIEAMDAAIAARDGARVYFAQAGDRIKIGWSRNVGARIAQLQTGNPDPVQLLATTPGARSLERQLHARFATARVAGEWFDATDELLAYVGSL